MRQENVQLEQNSVKIQDILSQMREECLRYSELLHQLGTSDTFLKDHKHNHNQVVNLGDLHGRGLIMNNRNEHSSGNAFQNLLGYNSQVPLGSLNYESNVLEKSNTTDNMINDRERIVLIGDRTNAMNNANTTDPDELVEDNHNENTPQQTKGSSINKRKRRSEQSANENSSGVSGSENKRKKKEV